MYGKYRKISIWNGHIFNNQEQFHWSKMATIAMFARIGTSLTSITIHDPCEPSHTI